jgi:hypothetical protein
VRPALNGYQKGHCFYCFAAFRAVETSDGGTGSDVDHFLPHSLMARGFPVDLDVPWNLVLACRRCNRGPGGKFADVPDLRYLSRLHARNEFLVASNHPLRESIIAMTGANPDQRRRHLAGLLERAGEVSRAGVGWSIAEEGPPLF